MITRKITVALAGNPNSGKTTVFNNLTGARQHVGNYPGVTVEKKVGLCKHGDYEINVVDLPGTYSLTAYSVEEMVARDFIIKDKPDIVVDIIDASNLERNLYLAVQFMELGVPLILVFNMSDLARSHGIEFDLEKLSELLGSPIVPMVAQKNRGTLALLDTIVAMADGKIHFKPVRINYGREIEKELDHLEQLLGDKKYHHHRYHPRWLALKLLEDDRQIKELVNAPEILEAVNRSAMRLEKIFGDHPEIIISDKRYGFISGACQETVRSTVQARYTSSDMVDAVVTNRLLGFPIFLGLMYLVFQLTFTLGEAPMHWIERFFSWLSGQISFLWPAATTSPLKSLLVDGIIGGVGGVIVFLPNILLLFLAIALLEDSGYMARAAFIMDRLMHKIGLHGKSFIPMLIGFGCSVPAVMATRMLENKRDRLTTMLIIPLMSCGARLPIYALIIPAFFPRVWHGPMLWIIYLIGIILAVLAARVLRSTLFKGLSAPFVMELPPYRVPTLKGTLIHMWERGWLYLKKAGTVILGISIVLWAMTSYPRKEVYDTDYDTMMTRAEDNYYSAVIKLNGRLGLPPEATLIKQALQAELTTARIQARFYPHDREYREAERFKDSIIAELENTPEGGILSEFLEVRDMVTRARNTFDDAVNESRLKPDAPAYLLLKSNLNITLAEIAYKQPQTYRGVVVYLDSAWIPYEKTVKEINRQKQGEALTASVAGRIGHFIEPVIRLMGFDWRIGTALIGAFAAKEVFVAQMGIVFSLGDDEDGPEVLRNKLRKTYTPLVAFCIMLFMLISMPCLATLAVVRRESNSWKWALFQLGGLTLLAFLITTLVYQAGRFLGIG